LLVDGCGTALKDGLMAAGGLELLSASGVDGLFFAVSSGVCFRGRTNKPAVFVFYSRTGSHLGSVIRGRDLGPRGLLWVPSRRTFSPGNSYTTVFLVWRWHPSWARLWTSTGGFALFQVAFSLSSLVMDLLAWTLPDRGARVDRSWMPPGINYHRWNPFPRDLEACWEKPYAHRYLLRAVRPRFFLL